MPIRIALVWDGDSGFPRIVTDGPDLKVFNVDERFPSDRVYLLTNAVQRVTTEEFGNLIIGTVHQLGDKPDVEQAIRAKLNQRPNGKPGLSIVEPE